jgi:hypothetical protein
MSDTMHRDAIISDCGTYRYLLQRSWNYRLQAVCFVMLNPSTADATIDDPTIRRCLGFARDLGFGQLEVVNLFGLRATQPAALKKQIDPVGPENDEQILQASRVCHLTICAWGTHGTYRGRDKSVLKLLRENGVIPHALRLSKHGHPAHPLYLPANLQPEQMT